MADATLTLDAEINTSDWNAGVKDIQSGSRQIEDSARQADEALGDVDKSASKSSSGFGKFGAAAGVAPHAGAWIEIISLRYTGMT